MARHISALKRARQNEKRRLRNQGRKTRVKHAVREVRAAVGQKNLAAAETALQEGRAHHRQGGRQGHPPLAHRRPEDFPPHPAGPGIARLIKKPTTESAQKKY